MPEPVPKKERVRFPPGKDGVPVQLWRLTNPDQPPVLLLHGASAQHETFLIPQGRSLGEFLWRNGYEPWLLDWRGSCRVTDDGGSGLLESERNALDFDNAAELEVPAALDYIRRTRGLPVSVVAHCMGAGVLSQAIAARHLDALNPPQGDLWVPRIVLLTLGLFYEPPLDGRLKSQDFVLERLWREPQATVIDPRDDSDEKWPGVFRDIYQHWAPGLRPHPNASRRSSLELCDRLSLMYGTPYREPNLVPEIHGMRKLTFANGSTEPGVGERLRGRRSNAHGVVSGFEVSGGSWRRKDVFGNLDLAGVVGEFATGEELVADDDAPVATYRKELQDLPPELPRQFGAIPLRMYLQGARNVRRRWAAPFGDETGQDEQWIAEGAWERFRRLQEITLITGARNQLWHRDSIDRMAEWLMRGSRSQGRIHREVLAQYAHQDMLWGRDAENDVFPIILEGLGGPIQPRRAKRTTPKPAERRPPGGPTPPGQ